MGLRSRTVVCSMRGVKDGRVLQGWGQGGGVSLGPGSRMAVCSRARVEDDGVLNDSRRWCPG
jgi:hypothetical protein